MDGNVVKLIETLKESLFDKCGSSVAKAVLALTVGSSSWLGPSYRSHSGNDGDDQDLAPRG
eukprot:scaffold100_cov33-Prasinocladus_malaysianus.AAC.1